MCHDGGVIKTAISLENGPAEMAYNLPFREDKRKSVTLGLGRGKNGNGNTFPEVPSKI